MPNTKQNNEIEHINKEINLLQDRLKKNEKSLDQFQNRLGHIRKIQLNKGKWRDISQTKKIQNKVKNIFQNKLKQIKKNTHLLQNILTQVKERKIIWKRTKENSKTAESFTK